MRSQPDSSLNTYRHSSLLIMGSLEGIELTSPEKQWLKANQISGITLFKRNILHPEPGEEVLPDLQSRNLHKARNLIADFKNIADSPAIGRAIVAIDQEGGRVRRYRYACPDEGPPLSMAEGLDDRGALDRYVDYGKRLGVFLANQGINLNFAPVCDVYRQTKTDAIGDRCFADSPVKAGERAKAFMDAMQAEGVLGCLKHFPGQGAADIDTHENSASVGLSLEELNDEMIPFQICLTSAEMVMISHCVYPQLDNRPATFSPTIISDILKSRLGFSGVVCSDDMNMGAVNKDLQLWKESIVESLMAGIDLLLVCNNFDMWQMAVDALKMSCKKGFAVSKRVEEAAEKIANFKKTLPVTI